MGKQPEFDPNYDPDADDIPTRENTVFIMARPHITFLKEAIKSIESGKVGHFHEPETLKKFRAAKDYSLKGYPVPGGGNGHATKVQAARDEFVQRRKAYADNHAFQMLLKAIDEYVDESSAPVVTEDQFQTSWDADKDDIVGNMSRFYGVITIDGKTTIYHILPKGKL